MTTALCGRRFWVSEGRLRSQCSATLRDLHSAHSSIDRLRLVDISGRRRGRGTNAARSSLDEPPQSDSWPRQAEPDNAKPDLLDVSWSQGDVDSSMDEAQLAKNRETFLLRLASLGFGAVLVGERISGKGMVQSLGHPTGIPLYEMDAALGVLVGALLIGGIAPTKWIYRSVTDEPFSVLDDVPALLGRLSCIGLAATIGAEVYTGKGVLGLLNFETGTETLSEVEFALVFLVLLVITNLKSKPSSK